MTQEPNTEPGTKEPGSPGAPYCLRDNVTEITPRDRIPPLHEALVEPSEPTFEEVTRATPAQPKKGATDWMGPVADTVLADFAFYGLLAGVPILFLYLIFGQWWIFRNAEWIALGLFFWFVAVLGWRRKRDE